MAIVQVKLNKYHHASVASNSLMRHVATNVANVAT